MGLLVDRNELLSTLELACRLPREKGANPTLTIRTDGTDQLRLFVQDEHASLASPLGCRVVTPIAVRLAAKDLRDRVKAIPSKSIVEIEDEGAMVKIGYHGLPRAWRMIARPSIEENLHEGPGEWSAVDPDDMSEWIRSCVFASGDNPVEASFIGEIQCGFRRLGEVRESVLQLCMTDGYRVAKNMLQVVVPPSWPTRIGISSASLGLFGIALAGQKKARLSITPTHVFLETTKGRVGVRVAECKVPFDVFWEMAQWTNVVRFPLAALESALVGLRLATDEAGGVEWHLDQSASLRLLVRDKKGEVAAEEEVAGTWDSAPLPIVAKLRGTFVSETIQSMRSGLTEEVFLRYSNPLRPFVVDVGGDATCMINPMHIK